MLVDFKWSQRKEFEIIIREKLNSLTFDIPRIEGTTCVLNESVINKIVLEVRGFS